MRTNTSRALRISVTGMGVAALGVGFAGTAAAEENTGQPTQDTAGYSNPYGYDGASGYGNGAYQQNHGYNGYGNGTYGYQDTTQNDPLSSLGLPQTGGLTDTGGLTGPLGLGGVDALESFGLPGASRASNHGEHELPLIDVAGLGQVTEDNGLLNGSGVYRTGLETPGLTGIELPLFD